MSFAVKCGLRRDMTMAWPYSCEIVNLDFAAVEYLS
jgi:hypothetical protein